LKYTLPKKAHELKKLAIVGSGPETRELAPFDDSSIDIWAFNEAGNHNWCKRWTACFQMHNPNIYKGHNTKDANHWEWLQRKHGRPIYMQDVDPDVPDSVRYPLEAAQELAGVKMFSSTFAYMAALAVMQGYEKVDIYGVELSASEYQYQAQSYLFWFGFLRGRLGNNVSSAVTFLNKNIFTVPLYGYEGNFSLGSDYFSERAKIHDAEWNSAEKNAKNIKKALDKAIERFEADDVKRLVIDYQAAMINGGEIAGRQSEAERYAKFGDRYADRGGFESAGARAQIDGEAKKPMIWHYGGMIEYTWNVWRQTKDRRAGEQMAKLIDTMGAIAYETGALLGTYKENIEYINKYDAMNLANGITQ